MKKLVLMLIIFLFILTGCSKKDVNNEVSKDKERNLEKVDEKTTIEKNNFVSYNGFLKLKGNDIVNQYGETIQLKGMSSHGLQWFGDLVNNENIKILKDEWQSNVFRLAMYTEEGGYLENSNIINDVYKDIDLIIENDMYVIVDWHILSDGNPSNHTKEAKEFFAKISERYKDSPNVIFEICNEPNGNVSWDKDIKPYAEEVIKVIRQNSQNIVIVGTGTWCQDVLDPVNNKIKEDNVMYAVHFYAGSHKEELRQKVKTALDKGLPIIASEWGTSDASGNGGVFLDEAQKWLDFMQENNISWTNWSLTNKNETSALLKEGTGKKGFTDNDLTESGKFVKNAILGM